MLENIVQIHALGAAMLGRSRVGKAMVIASLLGLLGTTHATAAPPWVLKFNDPAGTPGATVGKYFKDGTSATISYTADGLDINAPVNNGTTVVWTKTSFTGDIKVEFDYKRLDIPRVGVNEASLLVLNGWGLSTRCRVDRLIHPLDIRTWARPVATYDFYKYCMANQTVNFDNLDLGTAPRLTVRQNPGYHDVGTVIPPVLQTGTLYHVTVTRTGNTLRAVIKQGATTIASPTATLNPSLAGSQVSKFGYVGFRQMSGRHAAYRNIKISTR
jgi:hypothetical protein